MRDLQSSFWIKVKGMLFLLLGISAGALLLLESFTLQRLLLLILCVWSFCRAYYFAFYVIEKYVDPQFRFSGLGNFILYLVKARTSVRRSPMK